MPNDEITNRQFDKILKNYILFFDEDKQIIDVNINFGELTNTILSLEYGDGIVPEQAYLRKYALYLNNDNDFISLILELIEETAGYNIYNHPRLIEYIENSLKQYIRRIPITGEEASKETIVDKNNEHTE